MKAVSFKIPLVFLWVGFVCAISFMEAWIKFTASGVTLNTGLAIGQVVFSALNKVELTIALLVSVIILVEKKRHFRALLFMVALMILLFQTVYLLPALSNRIDLFLSGKIPPYSNMHSHYIFLEISKVISLITFGLIDAPK